MASDGGPPEKKAKKSYKSSYKKEWEKEFPIRSVLKEPNQYYCIPCAKNCHAARRGNVTLSDIVIQL